MMEHALDLDGSVDVPTLDRRPAMDLPHRQKMEILFAVMLGLFLAALDQTIVGPALPTIVTAAVAATSYYTWVVTIYLLTSTITRALLRQALRPLRAQADPHHRHHHLPRSARRSRA